MIDKYTRKDKSVKHPTSWYANKKYARNLCNQKFRRANKKFCHDALYLDELPPNPSYKKEVWWIIW